MYGGDLRDPIYVAIDSKEEFEEGPKKDDIDTV